MAVSKKIISFLEKNKVKYEILKHRTVYTAFDKAKTLKIPEKMVGKTLVLKTDGKLAMVLIPANKNLDLQKFKKLAKALPAACLPDRQGRPVKKIDFASERLIKNKFKGVKVGAIPPFGLQPARHPTKKILTFIDKSLLKNPKIIVNGGNYNFSIKISSNQLKKILPDAIFGNFSEKKK